MRQIAGFRFYKNREVSSDWGIMTFCHRDPSWYTIRDIIRDQKRSKYSSYCILFNERICTIKSFKR